MVSSSYLPWWPKLKEAGHAEYFLTLVEVLEEEAEDGRIKREAQLRRA